MDNKFSIGTWMWFEGREGVSMDFKLSAQIEVVDFVSNTDTFALESIKVKILEIAEDNSGNQYFIGQELTLESEQFSCLSFW